MRQTHKEYTPEFKLRTVIESYASGNMAATAARASIHITQLNKWRNQLKQNAQVVYASKKGRNQHSVNSKEEELEKIIGKQAIEIAILKKASELLA
jgi:transposase-like protein